MAEETEFGILVNLNDSENDQRKTEELDEIENTRMVADPETDCIMQSPTLPHNSPGSDDLITNEEFDFDVPLSPSANAANTTFTREASEVCEDEADGEDEDEVFFGPVGFTEVVIKKAAEEQEADSKVWSALTDAEMKEVFSEANRMAEIIQEARETRDSPKTADIQDSAASPDLQSKPAVIPLSKILDSAVNLKNASTEGPNICSLTVTKSPGTVSVSKETLKQVQTKLFSPSSSPTGKVSDSPKTRSKATPTSAGQLQKRPGSAPSSQPVRRTQSLLSRRSGSGLRPPSTSKPPSQDQKLAGTKRKILDMNQSADDLHLSLNSSNCSEAASETSMSSLAKSRLVAPSQLNRGSGLKRPCIKSSLQMPRAGMAKRTKLDGNRSSDELHTSLNSSASSDISVDMVAGQPPVAQKRRSLPLPSKGSKLPSGLPKPGACGSSGIAQPSKITGSMNSADTSKPAIKSNLTKLDKLKSTLGAGASRIVGGTSRLMKPGTSSMLARPSGPLKALKPASQQSEPARKITAPNKNIATATEKTPPKSGKLTDDRRKSVGSPAGHLTPKRTGVNRSQSFSGQRTPNQKISSGNTPGSGHRKSLLPMVNRRDRTLSSNSSIQGYGSSGGETPFTQNVLADIQNIAAASPSCFKLLDVSTLAEKRTSYSPHSLGQGKHRQI